MNREAAAEFSPQRKLGEGYLNIQAAKRRQRFDPDLAFIIFRLMNFPHCVIISLRIQPKCQEIPNPKGIKMDLPLTSSLSSFSFSLSPASIHTALEVVPPAENMEAMEGLLQVEGYVGERLMREGRRTMQVAQQSFLEIEEGIRRLTAENDALEQEIVASESRERQMAMAHQAEVDALHADMAQTEQECDKLNAESVEMSLQAEEYIQAAERAEAEGVRTVNASTQAQIAAIEQEAAAAQSAALTQQREYFRQELAPVSSALETIHRKLDATIQTCAPLIVTSNNLEARISSPEVVVLLNSIIDEIQQFAPAKGKLDQSRVLQERLQPPTDQFKALIHEFVSPVDPIVTMHV